MTGDNVYGIIKLVNRNTASDPTNTDYSATSLTGSGDEEILDYSDEFLGLKLTDESDIVLGSGEYSLWLLHWNGSSYEIPSASKIKFKSTDVEDTTANKNISEEFHTTNLHVTGNVKTDSIKILANDEYNDEYMLKYNEALNTLFVGDTDFQGYNVNVSGYNVAIVTEEFGGIFINEQGITIDSGYNGLKIGGGIKTNNTTFNILPDTATTINIGGAATELNIGKSGSAGTTTIKHTTDSTNKDTGALVVRRWCWY